MRTTNITVTTDDQTFNFDCFPITNYYWRYICVYNWSLLLSQEREGLHNGI